MKWSREKSSSLFTRVISKFKRNSSDFPSPSSSSFYTEGRFYSMNKDDRYWRISFSDDTIQPRQSIIPRRNFTEMRDSKIGGETELPPKVRNIKVKPQPKTEPNKAYSPRTECKIRALEEIRKSRTKAKKRVPKKRDTVFDGFAVVKRSLDPHRDFKDSMIDMIREKGIEHPDDLEELLACYLTYNSEEYHDLIISVFRQVWVELGIRS